MKFKNTAILWILAIGLSFLTYGQASEYSGPPFQELRAATYYDSTTYPIPEIIQFDNPSEEYIFTTLIDGKGKSIYAADVFGNVLFFRKMHVPVNNFQPHDSGLLTYYDNSVKGFISMDKYYNIVDTFLMQNGYEADMHEFVLQENGQFWMLSYDRKLIDMSTIVEGGNPDATVIGLVIQKLDRNGNMLFQWRSWDHFLITDSYAIITASVVDYIHGNSIDVDSDTSIILSSRNLNEVTRINTITGDIIWRLGGKNNQFTFINDERGFAGQHSAKKLKNGNLTLYDNGVALTPKYSRGLEYELDEKNRTVNLVKEYRHDPDKYGHIVGNLERVENGSSSIFWGSVLNEYVGTISEYDSDGNLRYEATFNSEFRPDYRIYRSNWKSELFTIKPDSLEFIQNFKGEIIEKEVEIVNNGGEAILINALYNRDDRFRIQDNLPVEIQPGKSRIFTVVFHSDTSGFYKDIMNFGIETELSLISNKLHVSGTSNIIQKTDDRIFSDLAIYPNPFSDNLTVFSDYRINEINLYDLLGNAILCIKGSGNEIAFSTQMLEKGVYIINVSGPGQIHLWKKIVKF